MIDGKTVPLFGGVFAIFGHGNVAGLGEALYQVRDELPTYRAHNEQGMAHAAIAFAKASFRRRMMAVHLLDRAGRDQHGDRRRARACQPPAAAAAAGRRVRQPRGPTRCCSRSRDFGDGTVSANDVFRPVSRYFDRITRPEQIIPALTPRDAGADRSGRVRAGDAGALPGRAGRGLRLSRELLRGARLAAAAAAPGCRRARGRGGGAQGGARSR